jgi:hypothetical protein
MAKEGTVPYLHKYLTSEIDDISQEKLWTSDARPISQRPDSRVLERSARPRGDRTMFTEIKVKEIVNVYHNTFDEATIEAQYGLLTFKIWNCRLEASKAPKGSGENKDSEKLKEDLARLCSQREPFERALRDFVGPNRYTSSKEWEKKLEKLVKENEGVDEEEGNKRKGYARDTDKATPQAKKL